MKQKKASKSSIPIRQCANVKSKKHPDVRCKYSASEGDFCSRHSKNPHRFQEDNTLIHGNSNKQKKAASKIQKLWRKQIGLLRFRRQGPITLIPEFSENKSDICTLDLVTSIPLMYRWSYADANKHGWLFDIRSLSMMRSNDTNNTISNPYTRENIPLKAIASFLERCQQLRNQKYCLIHINEIDLTPEQLWYQTVLDVSMKYDAIGYHISLNWLNNLAANECYVLYCELYDLWCYRLQLPKALKNNVVPDWNNQVNPLFKWVPSEVYNKRDKLWWQKNILSLLDRLVSAKEKEHRSLGALYGMTAFALASQPVREAYPWLVEG